MYDLILYDTSNFEDFPIGGQLTSIRNFLKYIAASRPEYARKILLVGVCTKPGLVGTYSGVEINGVSFDFLPVVYRDPDLSHVQKSLRLEYVKGLLKKGRQIRAGRSAVHYIHTPEAYIAVKLLRPAVKTAVFSHGSFFNMVQGFRFFQKNKLIHVLFEQFLVLLLKTANLILTLDDVSTEQYQNYTQKVFRAENSIVLPEAVPDRTTCHTPVRLLFVGRLSRVKGIDGLLEAAEMLKGCAHLTIVGDGEERDALEARIREKRLEESVSLAGSAAPDQMRTYYESSDILVMNSTVEGKPMVILEAMSYGIPVIATPVGGIPELVHNDAEALFTDGTPEDIARKTKIMMDEYEAFSRNAAEKGKQYDYRCVNDTIFTKITEI